jgi:hypothetical protein
MTSTCANTCGLPPFVKNNVNGNNGGNVIPNDVPPGDSIPPGDPQIFNCDDLLNAIALGNVNINSFTEQNLWTQQYSLMYLIMNWPNQTWKDCYAINTFYLANPVLREYVTIQIATENVTHYTYAEWQAWLANSVIVNDAINELSALQTQITDGSEYTTIQPQIAALRSTISEASNTLENIKGAIMNRRQVNLQNAISLVNSLPSSNSNISRHKELLRLTLKYKNEGKNSFTTSEWSSLYQIANMCPMMAGKVVYQARSIIYSSGDPSLLVDETNLCNNPSLNTNISTVKRESSQDDIGMKVLPNPATNFIIVEFPDEIEKGELILKDASGKELQRIIIDKDKTIEYNISNLSSGIYFLTLIQSEKIQFVNKFVKTR